MADLEFTGERYLPEIGGQIRLEHLHRYAWAAPLCRGLSVLDIACGEGYGSSILAREARSVVGVDISQQAVGHARTLYAQQNKLSFINGSATSIPLASGTIDRVVSFETLEHLSEQDAMLDELRRVLKPDGVLILSSPNRPVYARLLDKPNEFHVKELDHAELDALLRARFSAVRYVGQRLVAGSALLPASAASDRYEAFADTGSEFESRSATLPDPVYFVAICAADESLLPELGPSIAISETYDPIQHHVEVATWAKQLDAELSQRIEETVQWARRLETDLQSERSAHAGALARATATEGEAAKLRAELAKSHSEADKVRARHGALERDLAETKAAAQEFARNLSEIRSGEDTLARELDQGRQQAANLEKELHLIRSSRSWRVTRPLRLASEWVRASTSAVASTVRPPMQKFASAAYRLLPLEPPAKQRLAFAAYRVGGPLFRGMPAYEGWRQAKWQRTEAPQVEAELAKAGAEVDEALAQLAFPVVESPAVSIVIPTYGKLPLTLVCLQSIARNLPGVPAEVIVVEDASGDEQIHRLAEVPGLRYHVNPTNLGFLRSCNQVVDLTRGKFLYFLNNDTAVSAGWLDALVQTFDDWPDCGLVGSKLVYPNHKLQEAGGIVWSDASAWNYGRMQDPDRSVFNYARETDYCSGASVMIRRSLFDSLGRFDEYYMPAYCEDTDLAFKVRERGLKVVYQPRSVVTHFEGASHGTDESAGIKAYQVENQKKFRKRWAKTLDEEHFPSGQHVFLARERSRDRRCVLVIDHYVPQPDRDAGSRTIFQVMEAFLDAGYNVKFWPQNLWRDPEYTPLLQKRGIEVIYGPEYVNKFGDWIAENGRYIDYVFLSRPHVAVEFVSDLRAHSGAKLLYYGHDVHHLRLRERIKLNGTTTATESQAAEMQRQEQTLWGQMDVIFYPSASETAYVGGSMPGKCVRTLPVFGFDDFASEHEPRLAERAGLIFVAGFGHEPNEDAATWFACEVLPLIRTKYPDIYLSLVGSNPTARVTALHESRRIIVTGWVSDAELASHYARARVAIAPLRYGAGMKGKAVEAMRFGVPLVTTSFGLQGMEQLAEAVPVCDDPASFAGAVIHLLSDDQAWRAQRCAQTAYVAQNFSRDAMRRCLLQDMLPAARRQHAQHEAD